VTEDINALKKSFSSMLVLGYLLRGKVERIKKQKDIQNN